MKRGFIAAGAILALVTGVFVAITYFRGVPPFSMTFLLIMLILGFAFILVQGYRRITTFRTRLMSSAISLVLAGYFVGVAVGPLASARLRIAVVIPLIYGVLGVKLVWTDFRLWRWYLESQVADSKPPTDRS